MAITQLSKEVAHHVEELIVGHLRAETATVLVIEVAPGRTLGELEIKVAIATIKRLPQLVVVGIRVGGVLLLRGAGWQEGEGEKEEERGEELHIRRAQG